MRAPTTCMLAIGVVLACATPATAQSAVLLDQTSSPGPNGFESNDYNGADSADNQTADDFAVPLGQSWQISRVDVIGMLSGSPPATTNAFLYTNSGTLPGSELFRQSSIPSTGAPNYSIPLSGAPVLGPGTYWVSIQQAGAGFMVPSWLWTERSVQSGNPAAFRNPGGGSNSLCPNWAPKKPCALFNPGPDQLFRLSGSATSNPFTFGKLKRNTRNGTARLKVIVSGPGTVDLGGKGLVPRHLAPRLGPGRAQRSLSVAGPVKLLIKARGKSRAILNRRGKVPLKLTITYTATGASPTSRKKKVLLKQG